MSERLRDARRDGTKRRGPPRLLPARLRERREGEDQTAPGMEPWRELRERSMERREGMRASRVHETVPERFLEGRVRPWIWEQGVVLKVDEGKLETELNAWMRRLQEREGERRERTRTRMMMSFIAAWNGVFL